MAKVNDNYLTGKCLISTPNMADERFAHTLIYICSHTKEGAMGFVLNKKIKDMSFSDLAGQLPITYLNPLQDMELHDGGPLENIRGFVIHSTDYVKSDTVVIDDKIAVSSSIDILKDIAFGVGPKENIIALGYASWKPKQLEQEIIDNSWLVMNTDEDLIFRTKDEDKWQKAINDLGFEIYSLMPFSGHS